MSRKPSKQAATWHDSKINPPQICEVVWGYCVMQGEIHLAMWDGMSKTDSGDPFLASCEDPGDDYYLRLWTKCDVPEGPAQDILDKLRKEE